MKDSKVLTVPQGTFMITYAKEKLTLGHYITESNYDSLIEIFFNPNQDLSQSDVLEIIERSSRNIHNAVDNIRALNREMFGNMEFSNEITDTNFRMSTSNPEVVEQSLSTYSIKIK